MLDTYRFLVNSILSKNKDLYYEIKFAYLTGLRWNEQFSLLRSDFERTNFGPQIGFTGKGGKYRIVPLCDEALEIIEILLRIPSVKSDYLFYHPDTGHKVKSNRSSWVICLEKGNITDFRWHDLRHTYATDEIRKGMPIYTLSKLMGHANVVVTEKYAHLYTEDLHEAKRKVATKVATLIGLSA
jgi:integrase